jgi:hypothetical protein
MAKEFTKKDFDKISEYPNSFKRQDAFPLDLDSYFNSYEKAKEYAQNSPLAYVG